MPLQSSVKIGEVHQISSMGEFDCHGEKIWMTKERKVYENSGNAFSLNERLALKFLDKMIL